MFFLLITFIMFCSYFAQNLCQSCTQLSTPYPQLLANKMAHLQHILAHFPVATWQPPVSSPQQHCRNKAKMVVSGSVERPILGIINGLHQIVDLCECPLYSPQMQQIFPLIKQFIFKAGLTPYHIERRKGELKYVLLTESQHQGDFMLRFVLRSTKKIAQIRAKLPELLAQNPSIRVVSANILPQHAAILEGEEEHILTPESVIEEQFNDIPLFIRQRSFFQTNPSVAAQLYQTAQQWTQDLPIYHVWDLFCGVGGFGLHCTKGTSRTLTGIEISAEAIESATQSAKRIGLKQIHFQALDLTQSAVEVSDKPELVIVNPPRRGLGAALCQFLAQLSPPYLLYSSCNAQSLAKDLPYFDDYRIEKVQLFDMFPHTDHYEVLLLLVKK